MAAAIGMPASRQRKNDRSHRKLIRLGPAGRQAGSGEERQSNRVIRQPANSARDLGKEKRHGCGIRHDGKEKEMFDVEKGDPAGRQAGRSRR